MPRLRHPRFRTWTIVCWFVLAALLSIGCLVNYSDGTNLRDNAERASATVTAVNHNKAITWNLSFTDQDGQPQQVSYAENIDGSPKVGDHVEIYYKPGDPTNADEATDTRLGPPGSYQYSSALHLGLSALVPLGVGIYGVVIRRRDRQDHGQGLTTGPVTMKNGRLQND